MVEPGGGMRSRAHLGHPRAARLCADDRAIRSGPHYSLGRHETGLHISPDRDQQLTSEGDDGDTLDAPGGGADAVAIPARQRALGLMTQPQPGELDECLARAPVAGLADALLTARAAAGIGTGGQARIGRHVAAGGGGGGGGEPPPPRWGPPGAALSPPPTPPAGAPPPPPPRRPRAPPPRPP